MEEETIEEESKLKKIMLLIIGLFLVALLLSYIFVQYPLGNIIAGQTESTPLQQNTLVLDTFSIHFLNNTAEQLRNIYFSEQRVEFSVCLQGTKEKDYFITSIYEPKTFSQTFNQVVFAPCEDSLIILHSHPYKSCIASTTDIELLKKSKEKNKDVLMVVMCEPERFSVYN
jgi:proteasome lid subunit RPN8/RPN11